MKQGEIKAKRKDEIVPVSICGSSEFQRVFGVAPHTISRWRTEGMPFYLVGASNKVFLYFIEECSQWIKENKSVQVVDVFETIKRGMAIRQKRGKNGQFDSKL